MIVEYLVVVDWLENNRVSKYKICSSEAEAKAHVDLVSPSFPNAFIAPYPAGHRATWLVDPNTNTVSNVSPPAATNEEIAAAKKTKADAGLNTAQNKTILDALNELRRAVKGEIVLADETKAQYAARLKALWIANEP